MCWKLLISLWLLGICCLANGREYTIGIASWSNYPASVAGFKHSLAGAGFIEGHNTTYYERAAGADHRRQKAIAQEFRQRQVDLVYSLTTPGTIVIKEGMPKTTPIVFSIVTYPADSGLIESYDYSGNNLVGTSNFVPLHHYVQLLRSLLPNVRTVAIFHRLDEPNSKLQAVNLRRLLRREGIEVIDRQPQTADEVAAMAEDLVERVGVFITTTDTLMQGGGEQRLIDVARRHRLPILSSNQQGIQQGASFGPVADFFHLGTLSGAMAAKILKGEASPAGLQSKLQEQPGILINRRNMELLGIAIPDTVKNITYVE